jgi:hypothetical protein
MNTKQVNDIRKELSEINSIACNIKNDIYQDIVFRFAEILDKIVCDLEN